MARPAKSIRCSLKLVISTTKMCSECWKIFGRCDTLFLMRERHRCLFNTPIRGSLLRNTGPAPCSMPRMSSRDVLFARTTLASGCPGVGAEGLGAWKRPPGAETEEKREN